MEFFPSIKTQYPTPPLLYNPSGSVNPKRKPAFTSESNSISWNSFLHHINGRRLVLHSSYVEGGSINQPGLENMPLSVNFEPISNETQFDRVIAEAQQLEKSVVVLWLANWCRKCIYLKPQLEKLAADYYPRVKFYSIDVNSVPHKLVVRAGVSKMPTIQLWKDGKKLGEVIGGHKAYLVVTEVREMVENENSML